MKKYKIAILSKTFYKRYPNNEYPEILTKGAKRPYLVLLIKIESNQYAIPFRSNINHKYCFRILNNRNKKEGLDFTKSLIINKNDIDRPAHLKEGTLPQIDQYIDIIIRDFNRFLQKYKNLYKKDSLGISEKILLEKCTLKYFYKELRITIIPKKE